MSITGTIIRLGVLLLAFASSQWMPYEYATYMVILGAIFAVAGTLVLPEQRTVEFATVGGMIGGVVAALYLYFGHDYGEDVISYVFYSITGSAGVIVGGTTGLATGVLIYVAVEIVKDPMRTMRDFLAIVVAIVADVINTIWYALEGDWTNAGLSAIAIIPYIGTAAKGGKYIGKGLKYVDDIIGVVSKYGKKVINVFAKYGDNVFRWVSKYGDEVIQWLTKQGNKISDLTDDVLERIFGKKAKQELTLKSKNLAEHPAGNGHTIKITNDGRIIRCSRCDDIENVYKEVLDQNASLSTQFNKVKGRANTAAQMKKSALDADPINEELLKKAEKLATSTSKDAARLEAQLSKKGLVKDGVRYKPEEALFGNKKHGLDWPEDLAKKRLIETGNPQGQFGSPADIHFSTQKASELGPGGEGFFNLPGGHSSFVYKIGDSGEIVKVPANRIFVKVRANGRVHAYPLE